MAQDSVVPSDVSKEDQLKVFGNVGTEHYGGYFSEEKNIEWREINRVEIVEEMRRGDGAVSAVLRAIKSPLLSANWFISTASEDEKDKEIADFVEDQLFHMPCRSWKELLREILTYLDFGHSVFEKIWVMDKGKIILTDLAPRIQHSIEKWQQTDRTPGIQQRVRNDNNRDAKTPFSYFDIPESKIIIFSNDKEGDDVTGISILRSAYIHYYMKNKAYKIGAIGLERNFIGIPTGTMPESFGTEEKTRFENILKNMRANEKQYLLLQQGYTFEIKTPAGNPMGSTLKEFIDHHNRMIMLSVLAEFLDLGSGGASGSFALSQDQQSFFLEHVEEKARYISECITTKIIKEIVDLNFGEQEKYPKLDFSPLGTIDYTEISTVLKTLIDAGLISADDIAIQKYTRNAMRLPELTIEQIDDMEEKKMEAEIGALETNTEGKPGDVNAEVDAAFPDVGGDIVKEE